MLAGQWPMFLRALDRATSGCPATWTTATGPRDVGTSSATAAAMDMVAMRTFIGIVTVISIVIATGIATGIATAAGTETSIGTMIGTEIATATGTATTSAGNQLQGFYLDGLSFGRGRFVVGRFPSDGVAAANGLRILSAAPQLNCKCIV